MKRLLQFFGLGKRAKAKAEPTIVKETVVVPEKPKTAEIHERKSASSNDLRFQLRKHHHRAVRAKNRSARRMRTYNKIYA